MKKYVVIVPIREFAGTKQRLSSDLTSPQRARLSTLLLIRVLAEVERSKALECLIVASDPNSVENEIQNFSKARVIRESGLHAGVNCAMIDGLNDAQTRHPRASALLIPSDLPLLTFRSLNLVSSLLEKYDLLINSSRRLDGTNMLAFNPDVGQIPLHYDDESFRTHCLEAERAAIRFKVLKMQSFSFDVDSKEDMDYVKEKFKARTFEELLARLKIGNK